MGPLGEGTDGLGMRPGKLALVMFVTGSEAISSLCTTT